MLREGRGMAEGGKGMRERKMCGRLRRKRRDVEGGRRRS